MTIPGYIESTGYWPLLRPDILSPKKPVRKTESGNAAIELAGDCAESDEPQVHFKRVPDHQHLLLQL